MKPEITGCCFLPQKDCEQGGGLNTLGYMFITSYSVSSKLCCWKFLRAAASKSRCWKKSEGKIAGIKETKELGFQAGMPVKWHGVRTAPDRRKGWWDRQGDQSWRWCVWEGEVPKPGWQNMLAPGKEEEGNYHGSAWGNGYKGKTKVQDVEFRQVVGEKAIPSAELYWKTMGALGKSSFELDMER